MARAVGEGSFRELAFRWAPEDGGGRQRNHTGRLFQNKEQQRFHGGRIFCTQGIVRKIWGLSRVSKGKNGIR